MKEKSPRSLQFVLRMDPSRYKEVCLLLSRATSAASVTLMSLSPNSKFFRKARPIQG